MNFILYITIILRAIFECSLSLCRRKANQEGSATAAFAINSQKAMESCESPQEEGAHTARMSQLICVCPQEHS